MEEQNEDQPKGTSDTTSWAYVLGGVPFLILFFVVLFGVLVGGCDSMNILVHV
jgi:hypothetical protein